MAQYIGKAFIKLGAELLETMPGAKLDIGGDVRTAVVGDAKVHGFSSTRKQASVECEIAYGPNTDLAAIAKTGQSDVTINFETDIGHTWMVAQAFLTETPILTAQEGGRVPLRFEGQPAERIA